MYKSIIRPIFFSIDPEKIHHIAFAALRLISKIPGVSVLIRGIYNKEDQRLERQIWGLKFKNPVGLAAGLDKDAKVVDELSDLGFGFIEIGTVTPKPQAGNDKPRLFRLKKDQALINRMGFNNSGVQNVVERLKRRKTKVIIGGNIGKNKITDNEKAIDDYTICFEGLFDYVDYFVVNVSSPNTPGLRALQDKEPLKNLLDTLSKRNALKKRPKPILLKIAPDLTNEQLDDIISIVQETKIQGVIATNTTISRDNLNTSADTINIIGAGGLSGKPLRERSTEVIRYLHEKSRGAFPIIGVGGIHSAEDALEKLKAGASLVQIYTGFIYEGPAIIKKINNALLSEYEKEKTL